ncbi:MAG TPA: nicotinate phosphoribosyltransferase, partial [Planctomycetaceae bacterium]|nr:nicotinate phosphoribosyltransferase [Planctomycetaceae bacterium]
ARLVLAGGGRRIIDYGSRRAQGLDAALAVARSAWLAGCDGTALVEAGRREGIPIFGTMAHSYIQSHEDEAAAFEQYLQSFPETTLLVDTYDTLAGVRKVIELSRKLGEKFRVRAIRLDSGDIPSLARESRRMLDAAGLQRVQIFVSGNLDEYKLQKFTQSGVAVDGFGVGTALAVSADAPTLDMVYKLVEYAGRPRTKLSSKKVLYPGRKQIYRHEAGEGMTHDVLAPADADRPGTPLLTEVMRAGQRVGAGWSTLNESRAAFGRNLARLPEALRQLEQATPPYAVQIDAALQAEYEKLAAAHRAACTQ